MSAATCPACSAGAVGVEHARATANVATHEILLPRIHCMSCVLAVERILKGQAGIRDVRVNLSRKRASITATPGDDPTPWIAALLDAGYEAHESTAQPSSSHANGLLLRLGVAGFAMMNVMLLSVAVWAGASDSFRDLFHWIAALIALPATVYSAQPFFAQAWTALSHRRLNMDVPISLAIILACALSLYQALTGGEDTYFDAALSLTFFLLAGRYLEYQMRQTARSAANDLAALEPHRAICLEDGKRVSKALDEIAVNSDLWLTTGSRVPIDAILRTDGAQVDASALTGESDPVFKAKGSQLIAGEILLTGPVTARTLVKSEGSTLRRMVQLVAAAEGARGRYTSLADRAARFYAPFVHGIAIATFLFWMFWDGDVTKALTVAIATLIITCPCALGLAVPAVATVATGNLFRRKALVKSETALERVSEINTVIFDKTGTLTRPALEVPQGIGPEVAQVLKALAAASAHPLSQSLSAAMDDVTGAELHDVQEVQGKGMRAVFKGVPVALGAADWLGARGATAFQFGSKVTPLTQSEDIPAQTVQMITKLRDMGLEIHMLTGDTWDHARAIAAKLGIDHIHAKVTPEGKQTLVQDLEAGRRTLMIGDGLNDTLALSTAHASIAPGTALEASKNAADIVLLDRDLSQLPDIIRVSRKARRCILQNFGIAAVYNAVAIPLAVMGFATPLLAALAMSSSSILVSLNALRAR